MVALEGGVPRAGHRRDDLAHLPHARAAWEWWCRAKGIDFVLVERLADTFPAGTPATFRRWAVPEMLLSQRPAGARVALIDADTMIRWNAPDFFEIHDAGFCAVRDGSDEWIRTSIAAFRPMFPGVALGPGRYFNAGLVVVGREQLGLLSAFRRFCRSRLEELLATSSSGNFGTDQTALNFMVRRERHPVRWLPPEFNLLHCFGWSDRETKARFESSPDPDWGLFDRVVLGRPGTFDFIDWGYVWHFTNTVAARSRAMAETWRRVRHHYR